MSQRAAPAHTSLRGGQLLLARLTWVAVTVTVLAIVVFSVPSSLEHYRSVCTVASEVCSERALGQPTPDGVRALQDVGLSVRTYALLNVVVDKLGDLV
jgi:heme exporter protein D